MSIRLIAAVSENGAIGKNGELPWKISADLKRFRELTTGGIVVMGRKTFDSIGRPLPNRENWVLTRSREFSVPGVRVFHDWESLKEAAMRATLPVWIIGGEEIYRLALADADELFLTWVDQTVEGDAFFPEWQSIRDGNAPFQSKKRETVQQTGLSFHFQDYCRRSLS